MLRTACEMRHALHRRRTGADDADCLAGQLVQPAGTVSARILIIPATGMEGVARKRLDARNTRQFGPVQWAVGHHDILCREAVAMICVHLPAAMILVPVHGRDFRAEQGLVIEAVVPRDPLRMFEDFRRAGVLLHRHVAGLLQQRQVDVAFDVACRARIAVPVPGAAEIAALLHHADVPEPCLLQLCRRQQAAEPTADHADLDMIRDRIAWLELRIGVVDVVGEFAHHVDILVIAFRAQALVPFGAVFCAQGRRIQVGMSGVVCHGRESSIFLSGSSPGSLSRLAEQAF